MLEKRRKPVAHPGSTCQPVPFRGGKRSLWRAKHVRTPRVQTRRNPRDWRVLAPKRQRPARPVHQGGTGLKKSGRGDSNPRRTAWKAVTLPLSYARIRPTVCATRTLRQPSSPVHPSLATSRTPRRRSRPRAPVAPIRELASLPVRHASPSTRRHPNNLTPANHDPRGRPRHLRRLHRLPPRLPGTPGTDAIPPCRSFPRRGRTHRARRSHASLRPETHLFFPAF